MLKWQEEYLAHLKESTNKEILDEYTYLSGGDDYDGCFTTKGAWQYEKLSKEFITRLKAYKYL